MAAFLIGVFLLFIRLPMLALPSTDDMQALYATFVLQSDNQSWVAHPNIAQSRILIAAPLAILDALHFPNFLLAVAAYFANAFLLPTLVALTLWTINRSLGCVTLVALTAFSSFHPGLAEAEHFWLIRFNLTIAYIAMIVFVISWAKFPKWRLVSTGVMIAIVGFSYQGYINIALVLLTLLAAAEISDQNKPAKSVLIQLLAAAAGVIGGILVLALTLKIVQHFGAAWVEYFEPLPAGQILSKIARVFGFYTKVLYGDFGFPNIPTGTVIMWLVGVTVVLGLSIHFRLRRSIAAIFVIFGITLAAMQLPSLPFHQQFYALRAYPQIYLGLAGLIAISFTGSRPKIFTSIRGITSLSLAMIALLSTIWVSVGFAVTRYYDFKNAERLVSLLDDEKFAWDKPIAVGYGGWDSWKYWVRGNTNSMEPILSATWSAHYLIGFVANRPVTAPDASQQEKAESYCKSIRGARPKTAVSDQGDFMALCL